MPDGPVIYMMDLPEPAAPVEDATPDPFAALAQAASEGLAGDFAQAGNTLKASKFWKSGVFWLVVLIIGGAIYVLKGRGKR